jgi:hypothetical protein
MENDSFFSVYEEYNKVGELVSSKINGIEVATETVRRLPVANIISITTQSFITPKEAKERYGYTK